MSYQELAQQVRERRAECEHIAYVLRRMGFNVDWQRVNRNYKTFTEWHQGRMLLGYLIRKTGIQRKDSKG